MRRKLYFQTIASFFKHRLARYCFRAYSSRMPDFKQIARDYKSGETLQSLSGRVGVSVGELSIRLRGMRVKMRARGRAKKK